MNTEVQSFEYVYNAIIDTEGERKEREIIKQKLDRAYYFKMRE